MLLDGTAAILHNEDSVIRMFCGDECVWPDPSTTLVRAVAVETVVSIPTVSITAISYSAYSDIYSDIYI